MKKKVVQRTTGGWTQALFTLVFIVIPAILLWFFFTNDLSGKSIILFSRGINFAIALGFIAYSILLTFIFIWVEFVWYDMFNFSIPVAIVLMAIFVTYGMPSWARALIVLTLVFSALPINMLTTKYTERKMKQKKN